MGIQDRIKDIEFEMGRTQKNKATEGVRFVALQNLSAPVNVGS